MKKLLFILVLLATPAYAQFGLTTVSIGEVDADGNDLVNRGTACLIQSDVVLTCHHCWEGSEWTMQFGNKTYTGSIIADSPESELALIRLDRKVLGESPVTIGTISHGEQVRLGGFAGKLSNWKYQTGNVAYQKYVGNGAYATFVSGAVPRPGDSGGPVLDMQGNLVGITFAWVEQRVDGVLVPWSRMGVMTEIAGFVAQNLQYKPYERFLNVDPYFHIKRESDFRLRELQLELFIKGNNLVPPPNFKDLN